MEAPLYRSYRAYMINKIKLKVEVNIGISWQRIEIDPIPHKTPKFLPFKQKSVFYPMDSVVCCYVTERKSNKIHFRIVYCTDSNRSSSYSPSRSFTSIFAVGKWENAIGILCASLTVVVCKIFCWYVPQWYKKDLVNHIPHIFFKQLYCSLTFFNMCVQLVLSNVN